MGAALFCKIGLGPLGSGTGGLISVEETAEVKVVSASLAASFLALCSAARAVLHFFLACSPMGYKRRDSKVHGPSCIYACRKANNIKAAFSTQFKFDYCNHPIMVLSF